ncbi:hypothetical protein BJ508DRAFT_381007 [Ascobolus immersus RN42]|uniref:Uncharacterized protein n=1 Tax=Ascobolus immersus RN42 TaxID=1160509 RepID=A0A3N4HJV5_ASCIM|nr:hypothetical protein BJ508DRAFT_381007 [Ascobolus immersus RN42]
MSGEAFQAVTENFKVPSFVRLAEPVGDDNYGVLVDTSIVDLAKTRFTHDVDGIDRSLPAADLEIRVPEGVRKRLKPAFGTDEQGSQFPSGGDYLRNENEIPPDTFSPLKPIDGTTTATITYTKAFGFEASEGRGADKGNIFNYENPFIHSVVLVLLKPESAGKPKYTLEPSDFYVNKFKNRRLVHESQFKESQYKDGSRDLRRIPDTDEEYMSRILVIRVNFFKWCHPYRIEEKYMQECATASGPSGCYPGARALYFQPHDAGDAV